MSVQYIKEFSKFLHIWCISHTSHNNGHTKTKICKHPWVQSGVDVKIKDTGVGEISTVCQGLFCMRELNDILAD